MTFTWDEASGRFRDERGRYISESTVRSVVDGIADAASARIAQASERLLSGEMSLGAWQVEMGRVLKDAHLATATIANGGADQMTASRYLMAGREIKAQYSWLRGFAEQIHSGEQKLNGTLISRAKQYGQAARGTFAKAYGEGRAAAGVLWERNLIQSGESCSGCRAESARGWVACGTLIPVGSRRPCGPNCRCRVAYSNTREAVA